MLVTRRGFLGLLASAGIMAAGAQPLTTAQNKKNTTPALAGLSADEERLIKYFFPMLKRNEAKTWTFSTIMDAEKEDIEPASFPFYHKTGDKITVGYGVNVEANGELLSGIPIYHRGKALTEAERKIFLNTMTEKDSDVLGEYTIKAEDAVLLGKKAMLKEIRNTARILSRDDGKSTFLYDLPFCMQALAVDICYNVGSGKFRKYEKFKNALLARDYDKALKESVVYTNKETKATNKKREWSKKRLFEIMRLVQKNASLGAEKIKALLRQNYEANTTLSRRVANRHTKLPHEILIATAELECIQNALAKARKIQKTQEAAKKVPAAKPAPKKQPIAARNVRPGGRGS